MGDGRGGCLPGHGLRSRPVLGLGAQPSIPPGTDLVIQIPESILLCTVSCPLSLWWKRFTVPVPIELSPLFVWVPCLHSLVLVVCASPIVHFLCLQSSQQLRFVLWQGSHKQTLQAGRKLLVRIKPWQTIIYLCQHNIKFSYLQAASTMEHMHQQPGNAQGGETHELRTVKQQRQQSIQTNRMLKYLTAFSVENKQLSKTLSLYASAWTHKLKSSLT